MIRKGMAMAVGTLFAVSAAGLFALAPVARAQTGAQAGAQAGAQTNIQAGKTQAQAGASSSTSAAATAQNGQANAGLASGTAFNAALNSSVDSKKAKPGDAVHGRTTEAVKSEGKTVIPKGSKLVGHVTRATVRAKGDAESSLGIVFDKAILKNGEEIPLNVAIQALAAAESSASVAGADMDTMGSMGGSAAGSGMAGGRSTLGGVTSAAGGAVGTVTNTAANAGGAAGGAINSTAGAAGNIAGASKGTVGGLNAAGELTSNSRGVFGLNGLNLNAAAASATQGTVITSAGKSVHLDSGTRMLLVTQASSAREQGAKQANKPDKPEPKSQPKGERPEKP